MSQKVNSIRGMHDVLPMQMGGYHYLEQCIRELMSTYDYREIRTPLVEKTELFCRSIGEVTDIVEKEMYTFADRNGDSLTLRPENTASCVRAGIEHGLLHNAVNHLWYMGPMFRHERPQKGRYRQFHQVGAEVFGVPGPAVEVELILMSSRLLKKLGIGEQVHLEINSLGTAEDRQNYRQELVEYFESHAEALDEDSQRRLHSNPLRILDSKNPGMQDLIEKAPKLLDTLCDESRQHFDTLTQLLTANGISFVHNTRLVRGLDYYCHTVFEWVSDSLGAQGTVCAGGRYDGLIEQLGGRANSGVGWASGIERLLALLEDAQGQIVEAPPHAYVVMVGEAGSLFGMTTAELLRDASERLRLRVDCSGGSLKSQLKRADKSGARYALIFGEDEAREQRIALKDLRHDTPQQSFALSDLEHVTSHLLQNPGE